MNVEWKYIEGYDQRYMVSNTGEIKVLGRYRMDKLKGRKYYPEKIMKQALIPTGYKQARLCAGKIGISKTVHRIVAIAFIPNPNNLPCVNHKDGNKQNNSVENLEWVSHKSNTAHAMSTGLFDISGENCPTAVLTNENVREIKLLLSQRVTARKIAKKFNVTGSTIGYIKANKTWRNVTI